jgi:uncharacterized spore protein YtfJ
MGIGDIIERTRDGLAARTVFGEGVERDGVVVIPAARVIGGGGGGEGTGSLGSQDRAASQPADRSGEGAGGGFGLRARPVGAFVIRDRNVRWQPAIDGNLVVLVAAALGFAALLLGRSIIQRRN